MKKILPDKTPPMTRKPLQVHKKILDHPCQYDHSNDGCDFTTESGEESSSWQKGSRRLKPDNKGKKLKKKHMPPELIVTPAQVYDGQMNAETNDKEISKSSKSKLHLTQTTICFIL